MIFARLTKIASLKSLVPRQNYHVSAALRSLNDSPNAQLDRAVYERFMTLPIPESKTQACYVWVDGSGINLRCKSRTLDFIPSSHQEIPNWSFDGSSTGQGVVRSSDCYLVPVAMYKDPRLKGNDKLILCETYDCNEKPTKGNNRQQCVEALSKVREHEVQLGFEQEFIYVGADRRPFGWPKYGDPSPDGTCRFVSARNHKLFPDGFQKSYCGVGGNNVCGRSILEAFYRCCLYCGIEIYGTNAEVVPSQWEFQTGPTLSIKAADDLWMARFILAKVAEDFGVSISYEPKPFSHLNGSGLHVNFSTKEMREEGGLKHIEEAVKKLEMTHKEHIAAYDIHGGEDNKKRLTGKNETSHIDKFTSGIGDRSASVRISLLVAQAKKGFLEDRRPPSNADPYQIINVLVKSILL